MYLKFPLCRSLISFSRRNYSIKTSQWNLLETVKAYDPDIIEGENLCRNLWQQVKIDKPETILSRNPSAPIFSMCLPPPNVTGDLHMGHALAFTVQDVLARWQRMNGAAVLWVPGLDHAGIATQVVVERLLEKEGITRHELGREAFLQRVLEWKNSKEATIKRQLNALGLSLDWEREFFTLSPSLSKAVDEAFVKLFEGGKLYRDFRLVNWSCALRSAISDIEVENIEISGSTHLSIPGYSKPQEFGLLHTFAYPLMDGEGEVLVATTRIETMLGDTGLAVHPDDARYSALIGRRVRHPLCPDREMSVVADEAVDPDLGTGVVKVTPGHSQVDFEIGQRHGLGLLNILDDEGRICGVGGEFEGLPRFTARYRVASSLQSLGLYRDCSNTHRMVLPVCSRSGDVVEPVLRTQWFLRCGEAAQRALQAVEDGSLRLVPNHHNAVWREWLENCKDWCVSRQLWWGHRIPAYRLDKSDGSEHWLVARSHEEARQQAAKVMGCAPHEVPALHQDEDVLDTWFSSALLPFSMFGWPEKSDDLSRFYPLSLLETGHDILFFWVARMVMVGLEVTDTLPFNEVLLHGLICDKTGKKMSKSRGNAVDPMDMILGDGGLSKQRLGSGITRLGSDSLRLALSCYNRTGQQVAFDPEDALDARRFANKLWQACRLLRSKMEGDGELAWTLESRLAWIRDNWTTLPLSDRWLLTRLHRLLALSEKAFQSRDTHLVALETRGLWWQDFCDVYVEILKARLMNQSSASLHVSLTYVDLCLRLLHPFIPHVTEALWQSLFRPHLDQGDRESLGMQTYPREDWLAFVGDSSTLLNDMSSILSGVQQAREWRRVMRAGPGGVALLLDADVDQGAREVFSALTRIPLEGVDPTLAIVFPLHSQARLLFDPKLSQASLAVAELTKRILSQNKRRDKALTQADGLSQKRVEDKVAGIDEQIEELTSRLHQLEKQLKIAQQARDAR